MHRGNSACSQWVPPVMADDVYVYTCVSWEDTTDKSLILKILPVKQSYSLRLWWDPRCLWSWEYFLGLPLFTCNVLAFHVMVLQWARWLEERSFRHKSKFPSGKQGRRSTKPCFFEPAPCSQLFPHKVLCGLQQWYQVRCHVYLQSHGWSGKQPSFLFVHQQTEAHFSPSDRPLWPQMLCTFSIKLNTLTSQSQGKWL